MRHGGKNRIDDGSSAALTGLGVPDHEPETKNEKRRDFGLAAIGAAVSGFFASGFGLRVNVAERILTDDAFAGQLAEKLGKPGIKAMYEEHAAAYRKATLAPEPGFIMEPLRRTRDHFKVLWGQASKLKSEEGMGWGTAWKSQTFWQQVIVAGSVLTAAALLVYSAAKVFSKPKPEAARERVEITVPKRLYGETIEQAAKLAAEGDIDVALKFKDTDGNSTAPYTMTPKEGRWRQSHPTATDHAARADESRAVSAEASVTP